MDDQDLHKAISSVDDFKKKWCSPGSRNWRVLLEDFVLRSPEFPGDIALAEKLGEFSADLEVILRV